MAFDLSKPVSMADLQEQSIRTNNWVKQYVAAAIAAQPTPIDPTIPALIQALDQVNGEIIGMTAQEKVSAVLNIKNQLANIFAEQGFIETGLFRKFPTFVAGLIRPTGVYIEDTNGDLWTAANWESLHTTEVAMAVVVITSTLSFRIGLNTTSLAFGSTVEVKGLDMLNVAADVYADPRDFLDCEKAIIAFYNPAELGKDENGVYDKARLIANLSTRNEYFESVADMRENATRNDKFCYIVNNGGTTDGTGMHCYYWNNADFVDLGARPVNQGSDPYKGAPAFVWCWKYKAFAGDTIRWAVPNANMLRCIYQNKTAIQACFKAVKGTTFAETSSWSCQQPTTSTYAWSLGVSNGSLIGNGIKNVSYFVFACAAF